MPVREGNLEAPKRQPIDWQSDDYVDPTKVDAELERVFGICHGCRRCVSLCNAFPTLFDLVDESSTMEVDGVDKADYQKVIDQNIKHIQDKVDKRKVYTVYNKQIDSSFTYQNLSVGTHMITLRAQDQSGKWSDYTQFFVLINDILGCMNMDATNYNPEATVDDGSCEFVEPILGCVDSIATNFNPEADTDDGSCVYGSVDPDLGSEEMALPLDGDPFVYGMLLAGAALIGAAFAEYGARQSVGQIVEGLQSLIDAGVDDSSLNQAIQDLESLEGLRYFSGDMANAQELLNNYTGVTDQAMGTMQQLDELQSVVAELEAAGVSSPELEAEIAEIEALLNSQMEGDVGSDYSQNLQESFQKNKGSE